MELLRQRIRHDKLDYNVVNASISGETSAGGASRIASLLQTYRPDVVIIALGGNDGLRGTSIATLRTQLDAMVRACIAGKSRVVLAGVELPPNYGPGYSREFNASFTTIAHANKIPVVPSLLEGFGDRRDLFQADGVHPVASAQILMLDNVWRVLGAKLKSAKNS